MSEQVVQDKADTSVVKRLSWSRRLGDSQTALQRPHRHGEGVDPATIPLVAVNPDENDLELEGLAGQIDEADRQAQSLQLQSLEAWRQLGLLLAQARSRVAYGGFQAWVGKNCRFS